MQFERTALAYWRTALAAVVAGLLIVRQAGEGAERWFTAISALAGVTGIVGIGFVRQEALLRRSARLRHRMTAGIVGSLLLLQVVAITVIV